MPCTARQQCPRAPTAKARLCEPRGGPQRVESEVRERDGVPRYAQRAERVGEEAVRIAQERLEHRAVGARVFAQSLGGEFELTKTTIDAGGGIASGPGFQLTGTIAQPDANAQQSSGGEFILAGGFWAKVKDTVFSNGFEGN